MITIVTKNSRKYHVETLNFFDNLIMFKLKDEGQEIVIPMANIDSIYFDSGLEIAFRNHQSGIALIRIAPKRQVITPNVKV